MVWIAHHCRSKPFCSSITRSDARHYPRSKIDLRMGFHILAHISGYSFYFSKLPSSPLKSKQKSFACVVTVPSNTKTFVEKSFSPSPFWRRKVMDRKLKNFEEKQTQKNFQCLANYTLKQNKRNERKRKSLTVCCWSINMK